MRFLILIFDLRDREIFGKHFFTGANRDNGDTRSPTLKRGAIFGRPAGTHLQFDGNADGTGRYGPEFSWGSIGLVGIKMAKCFFRVRDKLARSSGKKKGRDIRVTGAGKLYETALPAPFCFLFRNAASSASRPYQGLAGGG